MRKGLWSVTTYLRSWTIPVLEVLKSIGAFFSISQEKQWWTNEMTVLPIQVKQDPSRPKLLIVVLTCFAFQKNSTMSKILLSNGQLYPPFLHILERKRRRASVKEHLVGALKVIHDTGVAKHVTTCLAPACFEQWLSAPHFAFHFLLAPTF